MSNQDSTRRSTAVQFFLEDEAEEASSSYNQVVEWLNKAAVNGDPTAKTDLLRKVQEIIINKEESLLDNFLDEVLNFQTDRNSDVRKFVVGFIEEACKRDPEVIPKVVVNLSMLLQDASAQVQKKVVQVSAQVYQTALGWLSRAKAVTDNMEAAWGVVSNIKAQIVNLIDSDNDGIRTHAVKFLERVVLLQTYPEPDSMQRDNDFTLEDVPMTLKIARRRKLEEEALMVFELLLNFHGSQHISSINLMTCMGSLTLIAKMRPSIFMGKVVTAFEKLHINLPPTLSKSQVSSVRKHLKIQLLNLLKHPSAVDYHTNITTLLTDLGATHQEIIRSFPRLEELRRRQKRIANAPGPGPHVAVHSKKPRLEVEEEEDVSDEDEGDLKLKRKAPGLDSAIDVTEQFVFERLTPDVTTQLVMLSMIKLPDSMPAHFSATYTPIAAAGTPNQIRHVARLMAAQLTTLCLGPGARQVKKMKMVEEEDDEDVSQHSKASISSAISGIIDKEKDSRVVAKTSLLPSGGIAKVAKQRIRTLKLSEITRPLDEEAQSNMMKAAVMRILKAERDAAMGGILTVRNKVLTILAATFKKDVRQVILEFLLEDLRNRIDLGFAWLYEEYSFMQGFNRLPPFLKQETSPDHSYNHLLCSLAKSLIEKISYDGKDGSLLMRLYLEAPMITDEAVDILKAMCCEETKAAVGLTLLQELVLRRPPRQLIFLNSLLVHTAHENNEVRTRAIRSVVTLYNRGDLRSIVEEYAVLYLSFLRLPHPPDVLFGAERGRTKPEPMEPDEDMAGVTWSEEAVRACLYLYLALLPLNEKLIHELAKVYVQTVADVKRTILRLLEQPVRGMGMDSPQLLKLVEECPKGAETLVTRLIHILTDKSPPSTELVARVRELYHTRVSDVRFLIPVLNGLTKKEVIAALPRLIKLNPVVVKEVFNRLLGTHSESVSHTSPLTPAELLIALHLIDPSKCELKTVIKATSLCFSEKQAYSQEVLAVVLQHLMDVVPLPTLLMRTVIQSLSLYPRLIGFVMNILQRLILKQVWKQKKVWEGFIKCCQRTKPQSFQVLLQLPPAQLSDVFESSPDLRQPLLAHVMAFTENQRAHIPQSIMDVLLGKKRTSEEDLDESMEAQSPSELTIDIKEELDDVVARIEPAPPGLD